MTRTMHNVVVARIIAIVWHRTHTPSTIVVATTPLSRGREELNSNPLLPRSALAIISGKRRNNSLRE